LSPWFKCGDGRGAKAMPIHRLGAGIMLPVHYNNHYSITFACTRGKFPVVLM
jgi:hypothetical protein